MAQAGNVRLGPFIARERAILERIAGGAPLADLLIDIVELVESQAEGMLCSILLLDSRTGRLRHGATSSLPRDYINTIDGSAIGPHAGSCGTAAFLKTRIIVDDIAADPLWADYRQLALPHGLLACWSSPIFSAAQEVLGTFAMYYRERRQPRPEEIAWVDAATHLAAIAVTRQRHEQALRDAEARARQSARLYAVASSVSDAIVRLRDPQALHDTACRIAVEHDFARLAWVGRYDVANDRIVPIARCGHDEGYLDEIALQMRNASMNRGPAGRALATGRCALSPDIATDPDFFWKESALSRGLRSCAAFPIRLTDHAAGLFVLYGDRPHYFGPEEQRVLNALADNISFAIESAGAQKARQQTTEELHRSEERLRAVIEYTPLVAIQWYDSAGALLFCNEVSYTMFGWNPSAVIGQTLDKLNFTPDEANRFAQAIASVRTTGRPTGPMEFLYRRPDGSDGVLLSTVFRIPFDGEQSCYVCMDVDLTERKQMEEARRSLEAQLQQAQRLQALGTLAAGIAHDFNNVLTAITGNTRLALDALSPDAPAADSLREIQRASQHAAAMVRQILAFGRQNTPRRETLDLLPLVDATVALMKATLPPQVELRVSAASDTPQVWADPTQLHQVVMNLITNAVHALGVRGGLLEIALARRDEAEPSAELAAGTYASLLVRDHGCGMSRATLQRVFEPFFTTKEVGHGTGLGLSVVHGIVQSHQGAVRVRSELGGGTEFELLFPAAASAVIEQVAMPDGTGQHILYVDDEPALVYLSKRVLERFGYRVSGFHDAATALTAFRDDPDAFDAVISDVAMAGMSGLALAQQILALRPQLPVLLTSGYLEPRTVDSARELGVKEVIFKPSTVEELGAALHRWLGQKKGTA